MKMELVQLVVREEVYVKVEVNECGELFYIDEVEEQIEEVDYIINLKIKVEEFFFDLLVLEWLSEV